MNDDQLFFPEFAVTPIDASVSLKPIVGREEPAVWVYRLAVHKSWPPTGDSLLRQVIKLRRGLNILWAHSTGKANEASRLAGHGAGKTTFCRLLRYVLGEKPAGSKTFREGFRDRFENGWVLAEVFVGGQQWLVGRPLSESGYHSFAKAGGSLDDESPSNVGFTEGYLTAIDHAVFGKMRFRTLADSQQPLDWPRLLPWLSRDQEAHFSGLLEWRHPDSDHLSPAISYDDKANAVRLVLGLVDKDEQDVLAEFALKAEAHESKVRDRSKLEFSIERERRALERAIGLPVATPDEPLLQQNVEQRAAGLRQETDQALAAVKHHEETDRLIDEVARRRAEWGNINVLIEDAEDVLAEAEAKVNNSQPPPPRAPDPYRQSLNKMGPFPGYCSHLMTRAWEKHCTIAHERPRADEITQATKEIAAEARADMSQIATLKLNLQRQRDLGAPIKKALNDALAALASARTRHQNELDNLKAPAREAARMEALLAGYQSGCTDLAASDAELAELKREKEALDEKLAELATHHRALVEEFSGIFNHLARTMLGGAVTGTIRIRGKALVPELEYHGPRDSAALKVVRWLLFDLAALALGMTNQAAHHPRFLIHDSPREADLAAAIYTSLFSAAQELENRNGSPAGFQYIITTTEAPGKSINRRPWLLDPVLDASTETGRLLGIDI